MLVPLMLASAFAVEYNIITNHKRQIQSSLDAATLAATNLAVESEEIHEIADATFYANLGELRESHIDNELRIDTSEDDEFGRKLVLNYDAKIESPFGSLFGFLEDRKWNLTVQSTANQANNPLEISLIIDISLSMNNDNKLAAMKNAAGSFIDVILETENQRDINRINLIPFGWGVYLSSEWSIFYSGDDPLVGQSSLCLDHIIMDGGTPEVIEIWNDDYFGDSALGKVPVPLNRPNKYHCPDESESNRLVPLHNDPDFLKTQLDGLDLGIGTGGDIGAAYGFKLLSPKWQDKIPGLPEGVDNSGLPRDFPSDDEERSVKKVMVFLTDGNLSPQRRPRSDNPSADLIKAVTEAEVEEKFIEVCTAAKTAGVELFLRSFWD